MMSCGCETMKNNNYNLNWKNLFIISISNEEINIVKIERIFQFSTNKGMIYDPGWQ